MFDDLWSSLTHYFNALKWFGHRSERDTNKLTIYTFLIELLTGDMRDYITEADYRAIEKALYCLYGSSCLISYPQYQNEDYLFGRYNMHPTMRITEDSNVRHTEDSFVRLKADNYDE